MSRTTPVAPLLRGATADIDDLIGLRRVRLPQRTPTATRGTPGGARLTRLRGRGMDFAEVRPYQPGDDARSIDWRVTARKHKVHTKIFREERERPTLVLVDQSRTMFFGSRLRLKSVAAAEAAALLAWHAVDAGDRVGGLVVESNAERIVRPHRNPRTVVRLLGLVAQSNRALLERRATLAVDDPERMHRALDHLMRLARNGFRIYLVSDFGSFDPGTEQRIMRLARHNSAVLVRIVDPLDRELPPPARYHISDGEHRLEIDTGSELERQRYRAEFAARTAAIEATCRRVGAALVTVATDESAVHGLAERLVL